MNLQQELTQTGSNTMSSEAAKTLRQTYFLLSLTLAFSGLVAFMSAKMNASHPGMLLVLVGFYGLFFAIHYFRNSVWSLPLVFMLTGFMGYVIGPVINGFMGSDGGSTIVVNAMALTALVFFSLSAYVLKTGKDMTFLGGFLIAGFIALVGGMLINFFTNIPGLSLAISVGFVIFSSAAILFETSSIIRGGQTNYVLATVGLFVSIYNLFMSLLNIMNAFSDD